MQELKRKIRFYFWLILEFIKKNLFWLIFGFSFFFIGLFLLLLVKPFVIKMFFKRPKKIGVVGRFSFANPPPTVLSLISRPVISIGKDGNLIPVLLTQWEIKEGGKVFRFYFRKDLVWNDGKKFSVHDIAGQLFKEAEIKPIDDFTFEVRLKNPTVILPFYLTRPIYRYPLVGIGGEYKIVKYELQNGFFKEIVLESKLKGRTLIYRFFNTEPQLINAFKTGKIDSFEIKDQELAFQFKDWRNVVFEKKVDYQYMAVIFFNLRQKLVSQKAFREAISYLLPWEKISNYGELSKGPIPPVSKFYDINLPPKIQDLEKAQALIKEIVEDKKYKLKVISDYRLVYIAEMLNDSLEKFGIEMEIEALTFDIPEDFDMLIVFWKVPLEIDQYFFWHSTQVNAANKTGYKSLRIDKYLEDARSTFSFEKQFMALKKFQEEIVRDKPAVFLYFPFKYIIERKRLF